MRERRASEKPPEPKGDRWEAPLTPREAWIEAFEDQLTKEVYHRVTGYAKRRAEMVAKAGGWSGESYADEVVQNIIGETYAGDLHWDPANKALENHLLDAVRWRTRDAANAAAVDRTLSLDGAATQGERDHLISQVEAALMANHQEGPEDGDAESTLRELRALAAEDAPVLALLDAIEQGASDKGEVIALAGMRTKTYHRTRARLNRLVRRLRETQGDKTAEEADSVPSPETTHQGASGETTT